MSWYNEPRRHALSAKGVKTAIDGKPLLRSEQYKQGKILPLSEQRKNYERYILDSIYVEDDDGEEVTNLSAKEKLQYLRDTFREEYGHEITRSGERGAFGKWMMGLPSAFNVEYMNDDIVSLAKRMGSLPLDATKKQEENIIDNYDNYITNQTFRLFDKYGVN